MVLSSLPCSLLTNGIHSVFTFPFDFYWFLYFRSCYDRNYVMWSKKKKKKKQGSLSFCSINHCCAGGFLDCPCPWLWCNQRVRPCCAQPEIPHLMRMLCPGSLSRTNTVFCVSHRAHNCADCSIFFFRFHRALIATPLIVRWIHQNTWTFLTWRREFPNSNLISWCYSGFIMQ